MPPHVASLYRDQDPSNKLKLGLALVVGGQCLTKRQGDYSCCVMHKRDEGREKQGGSREEKTVRKEREELGRERAQKEKMMLLTSTNLASLLVIL